MIRMAFWSMLFLVVLSAWSCVESEINFDALRAQRDHSIEIAHDVEILYSDSAELKVKVTGPVLKRYIYKFRVEEEFPEGIDVEFYDLDERPHAWLHAQYAVRRPNDQMIIARDSVVLHNDRGEKIEAPELIWNEQAKTLSTERFVKITRPDEVIYSRGFKSNHAFTEYELYAVEGDLLVEEFNKEFESRTAPIDSSRPGGVLLPEPD